MSSFYDLSVNPQYMSRKLFLDGQVSLQRFDENKYQRLVEFEELMRSMFWTPEEISLDTDKQDMVRAPEHIQWTFTQNLLRQTTLDSQQCKLPSVVFIPCASQPEMESLFITWGFGENVHNRSYAHIIKNIYNSSTEQFNSIYHNPHIQKMSASIGKYYDALYRFNCMLELGLPVDVMEHKKALLLAWHASYALESIRFLVSFTTSLAMGRQQLFLGNANIIELIFADELVHKDFSAWTLNTLPKDDPDYKILSKMYHAEIQYIYTECAREEKDWGGYLFKKGPTIGLNERMLSESVDFTARASLADIGLNYAGPLVTRNPFPWMQDFINSTSSNQKALQETEATEYLLGSMSGSLDVSKLPLLRPNW